MRRIDKVHGVKEVNALTAVKAIRITWKDNDLKDSHQERIQ